MKISIRVTPTEWVTVNNDSETICDVCGEKLWLSPAYIKYCNNDNYEQNIDFAKLHKTNKEWFMDIAMGSYYKLEDGKLLFSPMLEDGSRAEEDGIVDFGFLEEEDECLSSGEKIIDHLNSIIRNLIRQL